MSVSAIEDMGRLDYLRRRQEYIGGADAAGILGLSPFDTAESIYRKKTMPVEEIDEIDNPHIRRGEYMEDVVLSILRGEMDWQTDPIAPDAEAGEHMRHHEYEYIGGTPDAVTERRIYEIKAPTTRKLDRIRKNGVPKYWLAQCQHYSLLTGKPVTICMMDYNGWSIYDVPVERQPRLHEKMMEAYHDFWQHVQEGTPPDTAFVKNSQIRVGKGGDVLNNLLADYVKANATRKEAEKAKDDLKGRILTRVRHIDVVETNDFRCNVSRRTSSKGNDYTVLRVTENS